MVWLFENFQVSGIKTKTDRIFYCRFLYFIVDFYCAALKLVIEVDGASHFTEAGQIYDAKRTSILEGYGLKMIRFTNDEVLRNFDAVCDRIEGFIPPRPNTSCLSPKSSKVKMILREEKKCSSKNSH